MDRPMALKMTDAPTLMAQRVRVDPTAVEKMVPGGGSETPAIIVTRAATILSEISATVIDEADILAVSHGNWDDTLLIVLPSQPAAYEPPLLEPMEGDAAFLADVKRTAPGIEGLATETIAAIRAAGVKGALIKSRLGKWVNHPVNSFTLKAQPRVGNIHFTIYGNPGSYDQGDFLRQDQNSYSRGWIRTANDIKRLALLAKQAQYRREG